MSALADPVWNCGLNSSWAENWNILIPSWRESLAVILPTLLGAFCGWQFPIPEARPVLFQSVVGATIPFEITLVCVWVWSRKKRKQSASADSETNEPSSSVDGESPVDPTPQRLPKAPAIAIIVLTLVVGFMAFYVIFQFIGDSKFMGEFLRGPGQENVSEFNDDDIAHLDSWIQRMLGDTYPSLSAVIVRDGEID